MASARLLTAAAGLVASLLVSALAWLYLDVAFLFFFLPFVPFLFRRAGTDRPPARQCPVCGYRTRETEHDYCPRDGHRLEGASDARNGR